MIQHEESYTKQAKSYTCALPTMCKSPNCDCFPIHDQLYGEVARAQAIVAGAVDHREAAQRLHDAGLLTATTLQAILAE